MGCADWWAGVGSIDLKLGLVSGGAGAQGAGANSLLAQEVAEVGYRVLWVADELALGLPAVELFALDVREDRGDLAVAVLVGNDLSLAVLFRVSVQHCLIWAGPLTLEVKAIELYEFPNEIPIATRWAGSV